MNRHKVRENTFKLLFLVEFHRAEELKQQAERFFHWEELEEATQDAKLEIQLKCEKIVEKKEIIDQKINDVASGWKTSRMGRVDLAILRLAIFELQFDPAVPTGVAINEAVELAKKYGQDESPAFINGILAKMI